MILTILTSAWVVVPWIYIPTAVAHHRAAKGTLLRFRCRSIIRFTQWPTLGSFAFDAITDLTNRDWVWLAFDIFATAAVAHDIKQFYDSDEDDWWNQTRRRVKRWWRRAVAGLSRPTVPVPTCCEVI